MIPWRVKLLAALCLLMPHSLFSSVFDCVSSACPSIEIIGDAVSTLPNGGVSPFSDTPTQAFDATHQQVTFGWPIHGLT